MSRCRRSRADWRCPDQWSLFYSIMQLLPRGRAWQTHEEAGKTELEDLTILERYWFAFAGILAFWMQSACALSKEFFCHDMTLTDAEWQKDFGIPDQCSPWLDVCEKMTWQGEGRCDYFAEIAFELGWKIECNNCDSPRPMPDCMQPDCMMICDDDCDNNMLVVTVITAQSPAFTGMLKPMPDCIQPDCISLCEPDVNEVHCLLEQYAPAHLEIIYNVV